MVNCMNIFVGNLIIYDIIYDINLDSDLREKTKLDEMRHL